MVLDLTGGLFKQSDVRETAVADLTSGQRVPIGCILAWWKSNAKTPSIPSGFVECNGQVLNDAESVFDGETIPSLNATNRFLRGNATSGGTGGAATRQPNLESSGGNAQNVNYETVGVENYAGWGSELVSKTGAGAYDIAGINAKTVSFSILPPYYNIVWIIRIK